MEKIPQNQTDVPVAEAKAEEYKIEWGLELGDMSWNDAQARIVELNTRLTEEEKQWRLPTRDELLAKFKETNSTPAGFESEYYWSGTTSNQFDYANVIDMSDRSQKMNDGVGVRNKGDAGTRVRLVRDIA